LLACTLNIVPLLGAGDGEALRSLDLNSIFPGLMSAFCFVAGVKYTAATTSTNSDGACRK
jgi:hypothetical protein